MATMKALVYRGLNKIVLEDKPIPEIQEPTDAIVKIKYTTICGSDLHILQGHVPTCKEGITIGVCMNFQLEKILSGTFSKTKNYQKQKADQSFLPISSTKASVSSTKSAPTSACTNRVTQC